MSEFLKVKNHATLVRDTSSNAIIANDDNEFLNYKRKNTLIQKQSKDIEYLKKEMEEMKSILIKILNKGL
jgi:hypothetical protein